MCSNIYWYLQSFNNAPGEIKIQIAAQNLLDQFIVIIHYLFHVATLSLHKIRFNLQVLNVDLQEAGNVP